MKVKFQNHNFTNCFQDFSLEKHYVGISLIEKNPWKNQGKGLKSQAIC